MTQTDTPITTVSSNTAQRGLVDILTRPMAWLTGPILSKELRVASRRRRMFVLRLFYLAVFALILVPVWLEATDMRGYRATPASVLYRMADLGKILVPVIIWIQFVAVQAVAILTMSTSISDEIFRRTLGVLLSTPINAWQLVFGKLVSRMVQALSLLAMSLPILALLTVFGGVQWQFVLIGLTLTLTTMLVVASVTMFFSILNKRPYLVLVESLLALGIIYGGPILAAVGIVVAHHSSRMADQAVGVLSAFHPVACLGIETVMQMGGRGMPPFWYGPWWLCAGISVGFALLVLALCVRLVRRVSLAVALGVPVSKLRPMTGVAAAATTPQPPAPEARLAVSIEPEQLALRNDGGQLAAAIADPKAPPARKAEHWLEIIGPLAKPGDMPLDQLDPVTGKYSPPNPVRGNPVYWKDTRRRGHRKLKIVVASLVLLTLIILYAVMADDDPGDWREWHGGLICALGLLGGLGIVIASATGITMEREGRSWDMVLASTMTDRQIVLGKFQAALRHAAPLYIPLVAHAVLFMLGGWLHPVVLLHLVAIVAGSAAFIAAVGVLVGTFVHKTTASIIVLVLTIAFVWGGVPGLAALAEEEIFHEHSNEVSETIVAANPAVQLFVTGEGSCRYSAGWRKYVRSYGPNYYYGQERYDWPGGNAGMGESTLIIVLTNVGMLALAAIALRWAQARIRNRE